MSIEPIPGSGRLDISRIGAAPAVAAPWNPSARLR